VAELIICRDCDTVHTQLVPHRGQLAHCVQCGAVIARPAQADVDMVLAVASSCAILLLIANFTPVLGIKIAGTQTEANIWTAVLSMQRGWITAAAVVLMATMLLAPLVQVVLVLWLMGFARAGSRAPGFVPVLRLLHVLRPWSMSEVFLLGSLVAIVKLGSFIPIATGPGTWALAILTILLAILGHFDPRWWWSLEQGTKS
jgi:paraquat-inducible protein A